MELVVYTCPLTDITADGTYNVAITALDKAGNSASFSVTVIQDSTLPTISSVTPNLVPSSSAASTTTVSAVVSDDRSQTLYTYDGTTYTQLSNPIELTIPANQAEGSYSVTDPKVTDDAGNEATLSVNIDNSAPVITAVDANGEKKSAEFTINFTSGQASANFNVEEDIYATFSEGCSEFVDTDAKNYTPADATTSYSLSFTIRAVKGTYTGCNIALVDEAGNTSSAFEITETITVRGSGGSVSISGFTFLTPEVIPETVNEEIIYVQGEETYSETVYTIGSVSPEVQQLQRDLNKLGYTVSSTPGAPGSAGYETTYFGPATTRALIQYQAAKGLPQTGILDESTKLSLQRDLGVEPQQQEETKQLISSIKSQIKTLLARIEALLKEQKEEKSAVPERETEEEVNVEVIQTIPEPTYVPRSSGGLLPRVTTGPQF